jgi:hypothetical protein
VPEKQKRTTMTTNDQIKVDEIHALMEKTLMETYLKGKGYTLEDLKGLPEDQARHLRIEASIYASNKLAEVELRAHLIQALHDAYGNE